ncbi:MAG: BMP family ABC transporter substrate-binding protein [Clostridia bacterium]|nr:BMP family ABC transporter substrate-binding protein [Clostridia bacterium]
MKGKQHLIILLTCLVLLGLSFSARRFYQVVPDMEAIHVGLIYENDETTPYTYNFSLVQDALAETYGDRVKITVHSNIRDAAMEEPLVSLVRAGCDIIFTNSYSEIFKKVAADYPEVQFCQTSYTSVPDLDPPDNYHTFKGELYQAHYVAGICAGYKLRGMLESGEITENQAKIGFVGALPTSEVITSFTALLLGARSVCPAATLTVKYTGVWSNYSLERKCAMDLLDEGCTILSQFTDTIGPAVACEEYYALRPVYHVNIHQDMSYIAPSVSICGARVNWVPYVLQAVEAVMTHREIEQVVQGTAFGHDMTAGFDQDWVTLIPPKDGILPEKALDAIDSAISQLAKGRKDNIFRGNYTGVNPDDPSDTISLLSGYTENTASSFPSFHYILSDIITIED